MDMSTDAVVHNLGENRFELTLNGHTAVLDYLLAGGTITFTHTGVPPAIENRGIGTRLAKAGLEYARSQGLKVRTTCWFVRKYLSRHPEYLDLP
jgi:predicted GNAT family acetyltransferase